MFDAWPEFRRSKSVHGLKLTSPFDNLNNESRLLGDSELLRVAAYTNGSGLGAGSRNARLPNWLYRRSYGSIV